MKRVVCFVCSTSYDESMRVAGDRCNDLSRTTRMLSRESVKALCEADRLYDIGCPGVCVPFAWSENGARAVRIVSDLAQRGLAARIAEAESR